MKIYSVNKHTSILQLRWLFPFLPNIYHTCRKYLLTINKSQYCNKNDNALNIFFWLNIFQVQSAKTNYRLTQTYFLWHQFHRHMRIMSNSKHKPAMLSVFPAEKLWSICKFMCLITNKSGWNLQCSVILLADRDWSKHVTRRRRGTRIG